MTVRISKAQAKSLGIVPKGEKQKQEPSQWEELFAALWKNFGDGSIPEREHHFIMGRRYRADFAWPKEKVIVEIDGCQWVKGGHNSGHGRQRDNERDRLATLDGWRTLRFTSNDLTNRPIQVIEEVLRILK